MGGLLEKIGSGLTKTGLDYGPGQETYFDSAPAAGVSLARQAAASAQPATATIEGDLPEPAGPSPDVGMTQPRPSVLPRLIKPSFAQASTDASGMPAKSAPGLTRLGKLFQILGLAGQGAAAGQAAMEANIARSGGHYAGGFGTGFEAGLTEPARQAEIKQGAERGALQNEALKQNIAAYPWLRAMQMRREQASIKADEALAKYREWQMQNEKATEEEKIGAKVKIAQAAGLDPEETKQFVYGISPTKEPTQPHDELSVWREQHPNEPIEKYWKARQRFHPGASDNTEFQRWMAQNPNKTVEDYWQARNETPKPPTRGQESAAIVRKNNSLRNLEREWKWDKNSNAFTSNKTYEQMTPEEFTAKKQAIQDQFEEEVAALTGQTPEHYDYAAGGTTATAPPAAQPETAQTAKPKKGDRKYYQGRPYDFNGKEYVLATQ